MSGLFELHLDIAIDELKKAREQREYDKKAARVNAYVKALDDVMEGVKRWDCGEDILILVNQLKADYKKEMENEKTD